VRFVRFADCTRWCTVEPDSHGARSDALQVAYPILSVVTMGIDIGKNSVHVVVLAHRKSNQTCQSRLMRGIVIIRPYAQSQGNFSDAADLRTAFKLAMQMLERAEKSANKPQKAREARVPMLWAIKGQKLRFTSVI